MRQAQRRGAVTAVVLSVVAVAPSAMADPEACVDASDRGQRARKDGKLQDARDHFLSCAAPMCPELVQRDCLRWANDTLDLLPSIVIDAVDEDGHDIGDARVLVDGYEAAPVTEGRSITLDPGPHVVRVERYGLASVEHKIIAKEGVHARRLVSVLARPGDSTKPSTTATVANERVVASSGPPSWTFAAMGIGAATLTAGIFLLAGSSEITPNDEREIVRSLGWGAVALGSAATFGGLFGYFSEPASKPRTRAGITVTPVGAFGRF